MIMTPLHQSQQSMFQARSINRPPGEDNQKEPGQGYPGDFSLEKPESAGCPGLQILCLVFEIDNRDIFKGYRHMPEQDWERTFGYRTIPYH